MNATRKDALRHSCITVRNSRRGESGTPIASPCTPIPTATPSPRSCPQGSKHEKEATALQVTRQDFPTDRSSPCGWQRGRARNHDVTHPRREEGHDGSVEQGGLPQVHHGWSHDRLRSE